MTAHPCPRCGNDTTGSFSRGGMRWAICDDCMSREQEQLEIDRHEQAKSDAREDRRLELEGDDE